MSYNLKWMAKCGHVLGLATIGEVAGHMRSHYDTYFLIENFDKEMSAFKDMVEGREDDPITTYLTPAEIAEVDKELERAMATGAIQESAQAEEPRSDVLVPRVVVPSQDRVTRVTSRDSDDGDDGLHPSAADDISTVP